MSPETTQTLQRQLLSYGGATRSGIADPPAGIAEHFTATARAPSSLPWSRSLCRAVLSTPASQTTSRTLIVRFHTRTHARTTGESNAQWHRVTPSRSSTDNSSSRRCVGATVATLRSRLCTLLLVLSVALMSSLTCSNGFDVIACPFGREQKDSMSMCRSA